MAISIDNCTACTPGKFCSGASSDGFTGLCNPGYYCTGGASTPTQNNTEPGYYSEAGASNQIACEPGKFLMDFFLYLSHSTFGEIKCFYTVFCLFFLISKKISSHFFIYRLSNQNLTSRRWTKFILASVILRFLIDRIKNTLIN